MRQRLGALLAAEEPPDGASGSTETRPTVAIEFPAEPADESVGQTIGRYKLLEKVGEGGCGVVYVAEQTEPMRRRVAVKVIKLGMDTKAVVARFEAERQALAMMDHPNIAKVFDAGATETGRPFFVMELVRGISITLFCDQNNLATKERLGLFIKVCQAIQHAHQKGIIHRDIKPSNILVTLDDGAPVPKVIDFGIAKATLQQLTDKTVYTQLQQFIGTPAYMSPEQAEMSGLDIDTRSDIYSLGVLLYELLVGCTPFDVKELMSQGLDAMRQTIREKEPVRPSAKLTALGAEGLTTAARRRSVDSSKLRHQLRGDLDWITMKCLEKDRMRRYETANGLAVDIQRHLTNEPVAARPPSAAYKVQKFVRRNKAVFAGAALLLTVVLTGTVISATQALRARKELRRALVAEAQAQAEKANAEAALHFIQDDVLSQASPGYQADRDLKVRTLLDRVAQRLERATGRAPLVEAAIRQTLGSIYTELGDYAKAIELYEGALRLDREHLGESNPETLRSLYGLAMAYWWSGGAAQAEPLTRQGLEESRAVLGEKDPLTLQFMQARASTLMFLGERPWPEIETLFYKALEIHSEVLGPDDPRTLRLIFTMGIAFYLNWQDAKTLTFSEDALERSRQVMGEEHPQTAGLMTGLAVAYVNLDQAEKAEAMSKRCLELRRRVLGEGHPLTLASTLILARFYVMHQRFDKAEPLTDQALSFIRGLPIEKSPFLIWHLSALGWQYLEQGRVDRAETLCELALQAVRRNPDAIPVATPRIVAHLAAVRLSQRKDAEAEALLREGLPLAEKYWPDAGFRFYVESLLGASLAGEAKYSEGEPLLLEGCRGLERAEASMPPYLNPARRATESLQWLAQLYDAWGKPAQAAEWRKKLAESQKAAQAGEKNNKL
jgi:tetratricopeptide (TPR) repeat protein